MLLEVAELYYVKHWKKQDIASHIGESARNVNSLLEEAEKAGLVRITFHRPPELELQHRVRERFKHLKDVRITAAPRDDSEEAYLQLLKEWAFLAAEYFDELVEKTSRRLLVGISGGETLLEFVECLPIRMRPNLDVTTTALVGRKAMHGKSSHVDPIVNATILWARSGRLPGAFNTTTVPPYDFSSCRDIRSALREELDKLSQNQSIEVLMKRMAEMDVAIAGLGLADPPAGLSPEARNRLTMLSLVDFQDYPSRLVSEGAVGEIGYCFFGKDGKGKGPWELFLTPGRGNLRREGANFFSGMVRDKKTVMVIAGQRKHSAIRAALEGELFNVWITDAGTAREMLNPMT